MRAAKVVLSLDELASFLIFLKNICCEYSLEGSLIEMLPMSITTLFCMEKYTTLAYLCVIKIVQIQGRSPHVVNDF